MDKVEKRVNRSTREVTDGGTTSVQPATMKLKIRVTLSYATHNVFVKALKRSEVGMAFKPT